MGKVGLVLEGGGMRGMYTAGVLDVLMQQGIKVDGVVGVSAGAVYGCNYISEQIGRSVRYNVKYMGDKRYCSMRSLIKTGDLFNTDFCYNQIPNKLNVFDYDTFEKNAAKIPFYVVVTNLETGEAEYKRLYTLKGKDMDYMRASASLPMVSKNVELDGNVYLDGGTADSVPVQFFRENGYDKNIVVLTRPKGYEKKQSKSSKLLGLLYKKYPKYVKKNEQRYLEYNKCIKEIEALEAKGEVLVIRPSRTVKVKRLEKNKAVLKYMYKMGRYDAFKKLEELRHFA